MNVEVGSLRLEILLVQLPPPPQYDLSPRRSPAAGTGLDKPGEPHTVTQQKEQEGTFLFQAGVNGFLYVHYISEEWMVSCLCFALPLCIYVFLLSSKFSSFIKQVREVRIFHQGGEIMGYASQMDEEQRLGWP